MPAIVRQRRTTTRERRRFKAHDQLLVSVIKRQAGSLWKAVVEGVMNAVDAGATKCEITLTPQMLTIVDNGKGFKGKEEIEQFFETFGQPHEDNEDKVFGQFRMGRGQLFAYGRNSWRTGEFYMGVDLNKDGLDYDLEYGMAKEDGCHITVELYEQLTHTGMAEMVDQIEQNCKYVALELKLNDRQINTPAATQTWDLEIAEADIRFRNTGNLVIYNQGIKVCERQRHWLGCGGIVVTKQNLTVNFARNDIMSNCPVWAKIQTAILGVSNARATVATPAAASTRTRARRPRTTPLTEADRVRLCNQAKDGVLTYAQMYSAKLFLPACTSTNLSATQVVNKCAGKITFPPTSSYGYWSHAQTIAQHKLAFPLSRETLTRWNVATPQEFCEVIRTSIGTRMTYVDWTELVAQVDQAKTLIDEKELSRSEAIVLATLRKHAARFQTRMRAASYGSERKIHIGEAKNELSWTDGKSIVVISRQAIRQYGCGPTAWVSYALQIAHEMCHNATSMKKHEHNEAFYKRFHDFVTARYQSIGWFVARCTADAPLIAERIGRRLTRAELQAVDRAEAAARRVAQVAGAEAVTAPTDQV